MLLSEFKGPDQVPNYRSAITPGRHCPLFGAASVLRHIRGSTLIYLGTQDCVYYAQKQSLEKKFQNENNFRSVAVQLSDSDLIFGIRPQLKELLINEAERKDCEGIFVITSCSIELISEDLESIINEVSEEYNKFIGLLPIENFKTFSYIEGIEKTLTFLSKYVVEKEKINKTFAILGARKKDAENCEPAKYLKNIGYKISSILPYNIDLESLENLSQVEFTIVVESCGLGVAEELYKKYSIPYIRFDNKLDLDSIVKAWEKLSKLTNENLDKWINEEKNKSLDLFDRVKNKVRGKTFFYSQKVLYPFESCLLFSQLGMDLKCLFIGSSMDRTDEARKSLLKYSDPEIWKNAEVESTKAMLKKYEPDYFIGNTGKLLDNYDTIGLAFDIDPVRVGFEYYRECLNILLNAKKEYSYENI